MSTIDFSMYERISDVLCYLGNNMVLKFNVNLNHKDKNKDRVNFHSEVQFGSNKYGKHNTLINVKRNFDFYLSLENVKEVGGVKEFIRVGVRDIVDLRMKLNMAFEWFTGERFKNLYALDKNKKLTMLGRVNPIQINRLSMDKYIEFEPIVFTYENNSSMGIRMYLSSPNNYVDMRIDDFSGFKYLVDSINMYENACILINYLQRPEYGTNLYSFHPDKEYNDSPVSNGYAESKVKRTVKRQKSFFDKVDSLE